MIGTTISQYSILEKLGEGGMGVVYKALDTKLDRPVALKFLPSGLHPSEQDRARFMQEAKAAAAMNHPNVCSVLDIQEHKGQMFIVMEFVDGQTLRARISSLGLKQAVDIGIQVAEGLAAAHEKGIVHRDIKPENIMVRKDGIAQIMDFGLAKLRSGDNALSRLTKQGSTVGTAGYMSPEQVQGQETDHRSDIFALGVLLYEMITGQLPFKGVHETAVAYEIVNVDAPPMSAVRPEIDPALDAVVLECLEKDPKERTQSAGQVAVDLKRYRRESSRQRTSRITAAAPVTRSAAQRGSPTQSRTVTDTGGIRPRALSWTATGVIALAALAAGFGIAAFTRPAPITGPVIRASVDMPPGITYADGLGGHSSISPDGAMIAFTGWDSLSQERLHVRPLSSSSARALPGTEGAQYPFWSPDSRTIGFFASGKLRVVDAGGGPVLSLADAPFGRGGAWSPTGEIVFAPSVADPNLYAIPAGGGAPRPVTAFDSTSGIAPRFPAFLPDGRHFLLSVLTLSGAEYRTDAHIGSVDSRATTLLLAGVTHPQYASGHLLFVRQGILMAQPFDPDSRSLSGRPSPIHDNLNIWAARAKVDYSVSTTGMLLYAGSVAARAGQLVWMGTDGNETPVTDLRMYSRVTLSPDGRQAAYDQRDDRRPDIWIYDMDRDVHTRLTFTEQGARAPQWSHDGAKVFFNTEVDGGKANIHARRTDGSGEEEIIARGDRTSGVAYNPEDVSPDGRFLLISIGNESGSELGMVDLSVTARPIPVTKLGIRGTGGRFSPDGTWLVYQVNEDGAERLYVSPLGLRTGKWQVPAESGAAPRWRGRSISYHSRARDRYEVVEVSLASGTPSFSQPRPLFPRGQFQSVFMFGAAADGKRYLGLRPVNAGAGGGLSLIVNWQGLLGKTTL
jgi:Tol biopolymer transport system component/predicted Ser/Thr protein kinase